jgi:hypothetical protein
MFMTSRIEREISLGMSTANCRLPVQVKRLEADVLCKRFAMKNLTRS